MLLLLLYAFSKLCIHLSVPCVPHAPPMYGLIIWNSTVKSYVVQGVAFCKLRQDSFG